MSTTEAAETEGKKVEEKKVEGKEAGDDAPPVNIGWDSHRPVVRLQIWNFLSTPLPCQF